LASEIDDVQGSRKKGQIEQTEKPGGKGGEGMLVKEVATPSDTKQIFLI
jgi:hypothetical protein